MKKLLALILTLGFIGNAFAGCCGCRGRATKSEEAKPTCKYFVEKEACPEKNVQVTWSCPTEATHKGKKVQVIKS